MPHPLTSAPASASAVRGSQRLLPAARARLRRYWSLLKSLQTGLLVSTGLAGYMSARCPIFNAGTVIGVAVSLLLAVAGSTVTSVKPIHTRPCPPPGQPWTVAVSRSHGDARTEGFIAARPGAVRVQLGSAVKFARVAEGTVDIYPRLGPTSEWDIAAGHAVVTAAGGRMTDSRGAELHFGLKRADFIVPEFIAWGDPAAATF